MARVDTAERCSGGAETALTALPSEQEAELLKEALCPNLSVPDMFRETCRQRTTQRHSHCLELSYRSRLLHFRECTISSPNIVNIRRIGNGSTSVLQHEVSMPLQRLDAASLMLTAGDGG